jgi:uncharacterized protein YjbI with pentapeptide repeats
MTIVNRRFLVITAITALSIVTLTPIAEAGGSLNGTQLNGSNLNGREINGVKLNGSNLNGSNLNGANLNGSNLNGANLNGRNVNGQEIQNSAVPISQETGMLLSSPEFTEIQVEEGRLVGVK